jgi:hypothetical protein
MWVVIVVVLGWRKAHPPYCPLNGAIIRQIISFLSSGYPVGRFDARCVKEREVFINHQTERKTGGLLRPLDYETVAFSGLCL